MAKLYMNFEDLTKCLLAEVRNRIRNGELSERALARLTGISQPHIHNILNGMRLVSINVADRMVHQLQINLEDLMRAYPRVRQPGRTTADHGAVGVLEGWIGREHPYPKQEGQERYPFPSAELEGLESPVAARLAVDPLRSPIWSGGLVLLDRSAAVRQNPDETGCFAVDLAGAGAVGMIRRANRNFYLWIRQQEEWQSMRLPERDPLELIQGRVTLLVRKP